MRARSLSRDLLIGQYITKKQSHSLLTILDQTYTPNEPVNTSNYTCYQPGVFEKGPTNVFIKFSGDDIVTKATKILGKPQTDLYGPMATYFFEELKSGFAAGTVNIVPDNATYANMYLALEVKHDVDDETGEMKKGILYVEYDSKGDYYHMSMVKDTLPNKEDDKLVEIEIPMLRVAYDAFVIDDLVQATDLDNFLKSTVYKLNVTEGATLTDRDIIHVPLLGIAYYGALPYGNNYQIQFARTSNFIREKYPEFQCSIVDTVTKETEHTFSFALSKVNNDFGGSQAFFDKATASCTVTLDASNNNTVQLFRPWMIEKYEANQVTKAINAITAKTTAEILGKIKEAFPAFDENVSASDWWQVETSFIMINEMFTKGPINTTNTFETPFSFVNPWDKTAAESYEHTPIVYKEALPGITLQGGSRGSGLDQIIYEKGFDWDTEIQLDPEAVTTGEVLYLNAQPSVVGVGDGFKLTVKTREVEPKKVKFYVEYLKKCYAGGIAKNAFFDPSNMSSAIIFGEGYPNELQEVVYNACKYDSYAIFKDKTGALWTYLRTVPNNVKTMEEALDWLRSMGSDINWNCKPILGRAYFPDSTTGSQSKFSFVYEWLTSGKLYSYLMSGTPDGFGSGSYSDIVTALPNTWELVPDNENGTELREELTELNCNYFEAKEGGILGLGGDYGHIPKADSGLHTLGSTIQFNYMASLGYLVMRNNKVDQRISDDYLATLKQKVDKRIAAPARHFEGNVITTIAVSTHPNEVGKKIPLLTISVPANEYSQINRTQVIMSKATAGNN